MSTNNFKKYWKAGFFITSVVTIVIVCGYLPIYRSPADDVFRAPLPHTEGAPPLTIQTNNGRLGNQMFTFATLYGLCALNGRRLLVMPDNHNVLSKYFDLHYNLVNLKTFVETHPWDIRNWLTPEDRSIPLDTNIVKGNLYQTSFTFFDHVREGIRSVFRFKEIYHQHAQDALRHVKKIRPWTEVYVGVHVRRGDYLKRSAGGWLRGYEGREVDAEFFQKAVDYFRQKYSNVTFLAVSDDREWCRENLPKHGIMTMPDSSSAAHDLAFLAACNHTIMTYGTYGFWGGYLSGGEVVYFTDFLKPNTSMTLDYFLYDKMYPPDWVGISTTPPGYWETYTNPFLD